MRVFLIFIGYLTIRELNKCIARSQFTSYEINQMQNKCREDRNLGLLRLELYRIRIRELPTGMEADADRTSVIRDGGERCRRRTRGDRRGPTTSPRQLRRRAGARVPKR
jgi:hypothetical protein